MSDLGPLFDGLESERSRGKHFVAIDIETTGLEAGLDRIVELGAVQFDTTQRLDTFQEMVDPRISIPAYVSSINGITDAMVNGRATIDEVLPRFINFCMGACPVVHNAAFDLGFLLFDLSRLGISAEDRPVLDTLSISRALFPDIGRYSLQHLAGVFGIPSAGFHRALEDAFVCRGLFLKCLAEASPPGIETLLKWNALALSLSYRDLLGKWGLSALSRAMDNGKPIRILCRETGEELFPYTVRPTAILVKRDQLVLKAESEGDIRFFPLQRIIKAE